MGRTGIRICLIFSAWMSEWISSLPVAMKSFKIFSVNFPALKVLRKRSMRMCSGRKERSEILERLRTAESTASERREGGVLIHSQTLLSLSRS